MLVRLAAALMLVAVVVSVGSGSLLSRGAFVGLADAICADANRRETATAAPGPGWVYRAEFDDPGHLARLAAAGREALRRLESLRPPAAIRSGARDTLGAVRRLVAALDGRLADLRSGGRADATGRLVAYLDAFDDLALAAGELGLSECQGLSV